MNQKHSLLWILILCTSALHGMEKGGENKSKQLLGLATSCFPYLSKKQPQGGQDPLEVVIKTGPVVDMRFTKNDQLVTLGGKSEDPQKNDTFFSVWSASNGELLNKINTGLPITTFDVGSDGLTAATCCSPGTPTNAPSRVQVWLINNGQQLYKWYMSHLAKKVFLANKLDGTNNNAYLWVTNPSNQRTYQYETPTGKCLRSIDIPCVSIDQTHYIGAGLNQIGVLELGLCDEGQEAIITRQNKTNFVALGRVGRRVALTSGKKNQYLNIWEFTAGLDTPNCIKIFNNEEEVSDCRFKNYTNVVSYSGNTLKIWDTEENANPIYTKNFNEPIEKLETSYTSFATALGNGTVVVSAYPFEDNNNKEDDSLNSDDLAHVRKLLTATSTD